MNSLPGLFKDEIETMIFFTDKYTRDNYFSDLPQQEIITCHEAVKIKK